METDEYDVMSVLSVSLLIFVSDFEQHEFHQSELVAVAGDGGKLRSACACP